MPILRYNVYRIYIYIYIHCDLRVYDEYKQIIRVLYINDHHNKYIPIYK